MLVLLPLPLLPLPLWRSEELRFPILFPTSCAWTGSPHRSAGCHSGDPGCGARWRAPQATPTEMARARAPSPLLIFITLVIHRP